MIAPSEKPQDGHPGGPAVGHPAAPRPPHPADPLADGAPEGGAGTDDPEVEGIAVERVIFFSDAVVAIAITLLALALPVPRGFDGMTNRQLLHALPHWGSTSPS